MKSKFIIWVLGLSLLLTGCSFSGNQKVNGNTKNNTPSSGQTTDSGQVTTNTTSGTSQSSGNKNTGESTEPNNSSPQAPTTPAANINMSQVTAVRLADFQTGWVGGNGWIAKTNNGGYSWTVVYQGSGTVHQIFALNHTDVWVTLDQNGNDLKLLHSYDGGQHWTFIAATPNNAFLHFTSKTTAFSGNYLTQNGGRVWTPLPIPNNTVGDAYFDDENNGWVVTQSNNAFQVNRTVDGGKSWRTIMTKSLLSPLGGAVIRSAGKDDAWVELIGGSGMSQTSYSVFHTTDGGQSWKAVIANSTAGAGPAPGFSQDDNKPPTNKGSKPGPLYVVNSEVAFMGGSCPACDIPNSIGWTKDGGNTWVNSNVTLAGYGDSFLAFADDKHGWWITTENGNASIFYTTSDGGYHWTKVYIFH